MVPFGAAAPPPYPSLDPLRGVTATSRPALPPAAPPSRVWETLPTQVLGLSGHGAVVGPSFEQVLGPWFSAGLFLGLHSDARYNAAVEGGGLRVYPRGHAPRGLYLEAQEDLIQENAAAPAQGVYQAQRVGLALGWQWLLRGRVSVSLAGALFQEDALYSSHANPSIGGNHDAPPGQVNAAVDLGLGWDL
jgi:hypothetical protein